MADINGFAAKSVVQHSRPFAANPSRVRHRNETHYPRRVVKRRTNAFRQETISHRIDLRVLGVIAAFCTIVAEHWVIAQADLLGQDRKRRPEMVAEGGNCQQDPLRNQRRSEVCEQRRLNHTEEVSLANAWIFIATIATIQTRHPMVLHNARCPR